MMESFIRLCKLNEGAYVIISLVSGEIKPYLGTLRSIGISL